MFHFCIYAIVTGFIHLQKPLYKAISLNPDMDVDVVPSLEKLLSTMVKKNADAIQDKL
jgi:hypothetical protein